MAFQMQLNKLELVNFRKFERFSIDFDERLTVLVGDNGAGKSTILDAANIAIGSFVKPLSQQYHQTFFASDARIAVYDLGDALDGQPQFPVTVTAYGVVGEDASAEQECWTQSLKSQDDRDAVDPASPMFPLAQACRQRVQDGDERLVLPLLAHYGTGRLWGKRSRAAQRRKAFSRLEGYANALEATIDEDQLLSWFFKMTAQDVQRAQSLLPRDESSQFAAVRRAVEHIFGSITGSKNVNVTYSFDTDDLSVEYLDQEGAAHQLPLSQFSDGYRSVLGMVADIAYRMALLNPMLGAEVLETQGIVLIDEIDLHLHPLWQARILADLQTVFPNIQFIVTTHAPVVISSVRAQNIRMLDGEEGAHTPQQEIYGSDAGRALMAVLQVPERPVEVQSAFDSFYRSLDQGDFVAAREQLDELKRLVGTDDTGYVSACTAFELEETEARYASD